MKKWFDFHCQQQKVQSDTKCYQTYNLNNIKNGHKILEFMQQFKEGYYNKTISTEKKNIYRPGSFYLHNELAKAFDLPTAQVDEWFSDPDYINLAVNSETDQLSLNDTEFKRLCAELIPIVSEVFNLIPETMFPIVHVLKPGQFYPLHLDYARVRQKGLGYNPVMSDQHSVRDDPDHTKILMFFDDWQPGQIWHIDNDIVKWRAGDIMHYNIRDCVHGSCNIGYDNRFMLWVAGQYKNGHWEPPTLL